MQSMGSQRVGHDWMTKPSKTDITNSFCLHTNYRIKILKEKKKKILFLKQVKHVCLLHWQSSLLYTHYLVSLTNPRWRENDLISSLGSTATTLIIQTQCGHSAPSRPPNCEQPTGRPGQRTEEPQRSHHGSSISAKILCRLEINDTSHWAFTNMLSSLWVSRADTPDCQSHQNTGLPPKITTPLLQAQPITAPFLRPHLKRDCMQIPLEETWKYLASFS